jgi:hypothetical protein
MDPAGLSGPFVAVQIGSSVPRRIAQFPFLALVEGEGPKEDSVFAFPLFAQHFASFDLHQSLASRLTR